MTGVDYGQLIWHVCLSLNTDRTDDWEDYCQLVTDGTPHLLLALAYVPVLLSAVGVMIAVHSPSVRSTAQTPHRQLSLDTLPPPSFLSCPTVNLIAESLQWFRAVCADQAAAAATVGQDSSIAPSPPSSS
jgi:hypothetical protein